MSNEKVFGQGKEEQQILTSITQRQLKFFEHVIKENSLERLVFEGQIDVSRSRRRQRIKYLNYLMAAVGCLWKGEVFHLTQDREIHIHGCEHQLAWHNNKKKIKCWHLFSLMNIIEVQGWTTPIVQKVCSCQILSTSGPAGSCIDCSKT